MSILFCRPTNEYRIQWPLARLRAFLGQKCRAILLRLDTGNASCTRVVIAVCRLNEDGRKLADYAQPSEIKNDSRVDVVMLEYSTEFDKKCVDILEQVLLNDPRRDQ